MNCFDKDFCSHLIKRFRNGTDEFVCDLDSRVILGVLSCSRFEDKEISDTKKDKAKK